MIYRSLVLALLAAPAVAQDQAQAARNAARALEEASVQLDAAESARDQVRALTQHFDQLVRESDIDARSVPDEILSYLG